MAQQFHQARAQVLSAGVTFGPYATLELQKVTGIARQFGWVGSDKDARDTRKTTAGLNTQYKVRVPELMKRFSFKNA